MQARVRPARASDRGPLMEFIKDVWGGHDYIPFVWDSWLRDRSGLMFVVEVGGTPLGMSRVKFPEDGSAWFEGARVHPEHRGQGLASLLGEKSMKSAAGRGARLFRLTSGSRNRAAHRQIARMGFREKSRFSVYAPPAASNGRRSLPTRLRRGEGGRALRMMRGTREFALGGGVYWHAFTAAALTPKVASKLVDEGAVWRLREAVAVSREVKEGVRVWEEVGFVGGPAEEAMELVASLVGRTKGASERWVFLPQGTPIVARVRERGFTRDLSLVLFERAAANG